MPGWILGALLLLPATGIALDSVRTVMRLRALQQRGEVRVARLEGRAPAGPVCYSYRSPQGTLYRGRGMIPPPAAVITLLPENPRVHVLGAVPPERTRAAAFQGVRRSLLALLTGAMLALVVVLADRARGTSGHGGE